jgi:hypothetical protein
MYVPVSFQGYSTRAARRLASSHVSMGVTSRSIERFLRSGLSSKDLAACRVVN